MLGAAINVIPLMVQRNVPGIGPYVLYAYLLGAVPAILAALAYASLASAMPRAGGSYVYASRSLNPYLGFIASFAHWFGLCMAIGVVSYLLIPFLRDIATALSMTGLADILDGGVVRVTAALSFLWLFAGVNLLGVKSYERTLVPLMFLMFAAGVVVIISGFSFDHADFAAAVVRQEGVVVPPPPPAPFELGKLLAAAAILFTSFIGFDSIAQAGGEAKNPNRSLPLAIGISVIVVGSFYMLFTAAVYHTVPWQYVAQEAALRDITAPGLLGVNFVHVHGAGMVECLRDGALGDFIENDALRFLWRQLQGAGQMPGDRFAFAVEVGGEIDHVRLGGELSQIGDQLGTAGQDVVNRLEVVIEVSAQFALGQIPNVAHRSPDSIAGAEIFLDGFGLRRRFHDDQRTAAVRPGLGLLGRLLGGFTGRLGFLL